MRLLLAITSEEGRELGHRARCEFGEDGGTIGRNAACTWVLPDPTNVLSARHATIAHNGRGFEIFDTSTNGVYVNTVRAPIGRGASALLADGDTLYLGSFEVSVAILEDAAEERRRLGVGSGAITLRSEPPSLGEAPMPRSRPSGDNELWDFGNAPAPGAAPPLSRAPSPAPAAMRLNPETRIAAPLPPAALNPDPFDFGPAARNEPAAASFAPAAPPARPVIPVDVFADLLGPAAISKGPGEATQGGFGSPTSAGRPDPLGFAAPRSDPLSFAAPAAAPRPDPLSFTAPQAPRAGASGIPDAFDFSDLMKPAAPVQRPVAAAPLPAMPFPDPLPTAPAAPPPAEPLPAPMPPQLAPRPQPQPAPLSPSLTADLISLRPPGADGETAGARALDPIVVLRQRAAGQGRQAADAAPAAAPVAPAPRSRDASLPLPQPRDRGAATGPESADSARLVEAFWNGLGVDPRQTPPERQAELLAECGRALREAVVGLVPTLNARRSMKDELRIDQTRLQPKENNPLKFLPSGEAVLKALVDRELDGFLPLSQALREGLNDIKAHEVATLVALDAVVKSTLARFDPVALEAQGGAAGKMFGRGPDKSRLWDHFVRVYAGLSGNLEETTRKLVGEEFARAYAQQVEKFGRGGV